MRHYHSGQLLVTGTTELASSAQLVPVVVAKGQLHSMQFKVKNSIYKKKVSPQVSTIETEFRKYVLSLLSSEETSILQFWEVRFLCLNSTMVTHSWNRLIGLNFRHCL